MVPARITVPNTYESRACRRAVCRTADDWRSVSDTWKVMPMVKAR
jgi:hypothetical protein